MTEENKKDVIKMKNKQTKKSCQNCENITENYNCCGCNINPNKHLLVKE